MTRFIKTHAIQVVIATVALVVVGLILFLRPTKSQTGADIKLSDLSVVSTSTPQLATETISTPENQEVSSILPNTNNWTIKAVVPSKQIQTMSESSFYAGYPQDGNFLSREDVKNAARVETLVSAVILPEETEGQWKTTYIPEERDPNWYRAEENEVTYSPTIKALAEKLGKDPLKILNFVRREVAYTPYYGLKKGAAATALERKGNDADQSALLIALLRYNKIPARYRVAEVKINIGTVTGLLGVSTAEVAAEVLGAHGIPYTFVLDDVGNPSFFILEHVYVEAYIPYGYSRGSDISDGGVSQWVLLEPTINTYYQELLVDVVDEMEKSEFNVGTFFKNYISGSYGSLAPNKALKKEVETHLANNPPRFYPDLTYEDARLREYAGGNNLDFIPGSLEFEVVKDLGFFRSLPDNMRHILVFRVYDKEGNGFVYPMNVYDAANKEITLTSSFASDGDKEKLSQYDAIFDIPLPSGINLKPSIALNGLVSAVGDINVQLGSKLFYDIAYRYPTKSIGGGTVEMSAPVIHDSIIVGNNHVIAMDTGGVVPPPLLPAEEQRSISILSTQIMYGVANNYLMTLEQSGEEIARVLGGVSTDLATFVVMHSTVEADFDREGNPINRMRWTGVALKPHSSVSYYARTGQDATKHGKTFMLLYGLEASFLESEMLERSFKIKAISGLRGLQQIADDRSGKQSLVEISTSTRSVIEQLDSSDDFKRLLSSAIDGGSVVYTIKKPTSYFDWEGMPYIIINETDRSMLFGTRK